MPPIDSDVQRLLDHLGLRPKANNTKWIRLFNETFKEHHINRVLVKFIDIDHPIEINEGIATKKTGMLRDDQAWEKWPLNYIHWIEVPGNTELQKVLMDKVYSFRAIGPKLRIFGYGKN